jgi:hypothetical protein
LGEKIKNLVIIECPTPAVMKYGVQVRIGIGKPDWKFDQRSGLEVWPEAEQEVGPKWGWAKTGGWEGMHGLGPDIQI